MELKRSSRRWMTLMMLFILGNVSTSSASEDTMDLQLDCYNDCERMFCRFQPQEQSCSDYNLNLSNPLAFGDNEKEKNCVLQYDTGLCCCSAGIEFVIREIYNVTVRKRGKIMEVKVIDLIRSLKPKIPTITSVNESNGNFEVRWRTNMENCPIPEYSADVTYWRKGDKQVTHHNFNKDYVNSAYYQIPAQDLEPSTTYVVSLRSFQDQSGRFSDSSEEWEFTAAAKPQSPLIVATISLSFAAVIVTTAAFGCYVKLKAKWKKSIALCPVPVLLEMRLGKQELLKPTEVSVCLVAIDPVVQKDSPTSLETSSKDPNSKSQQQSNGVCAHSFSFSSVDVEAEIQKALREKLGHLLPASSVTSSQPTGPNTDSRFPFDVSTNDSHSSPECICFDNLTYSSRVGSKQSTSQTEKVTVDSAYHRNESNPWDQHAPTCQVSTEQVLVPKVASSLVMTDLSYQMSSVNSGAFSLVHDSSLSSVSCDINTTASCDLVPSAEAAGDSSDSGVMKLNDKKEDGAFCYREPCFEP
ncbi:uncharacterized protein LOC121635866 [Melanotaenia boesemani]|uniref:uncharacterized protein LOC121635866 n=1 Tax=Melanotaenia boesemani TaxID=1250792 RepID=UPI001C045D09|nr:uncharacterized protein LOC121635866 [Melanotaenia boesemani]